MTPKERILAVLNRQPVDRLPVDLWHTPEVAASLRQHFGVTDDFAMWRALGLDKIVWDFMDYRTDAGERAGGQSVGRTGRERRARAGAERPCFTVSKPGPKRFAAQLR